MKLPDITPGPWEAFRRPQGVGIAGRTAADFVIPTSLTAEERECAPYYAIARCSTSLNGFDPIAERTANAKAISAVPVMLEALGETRSLLRHGAAVSDEYREMVFDKVVAALRLAGAVE